MHLFLAGFMVMLGVLAAVAAAPAIFAGAVVAAKGLGLLLLVGVVVAMAALKRQ